MFLSEAFLDTVHLSMFEQVSVAVHLLSAQRCLIKQAELWAKDRNIEMKLCRNTWSHR